MSPAISVVIPTYNSVALLGEALRSVFDQTLDQGEIEVIVIDDGSTDSTWDFLQEIVRQHSNVFALYQSNAGRPSLGRNRGIEAAKGEFIFFLDSDDWFGPEALERLLLAAREAESDVILGRQRGENRTVSSSAFGETIMDAELLEDGLWNVLSPCRLFRRSLIEKIGARFPEDMVQGEDQVFVAACCFAAKRISVLADYDYYFVRGRIDGGNLSQSVQTFENKYMTTTRMAAIIVENTEPGRQREQYFQRVIYRTLAPGLGKPFMAAHLSERARYLSRMQEDVLVYMSNDDLKTQRDVPRLRLAVAREGSDRDLANLNRLVLAGLKSTWENGQLVLDLGQDLNELVGPELRVRRNELASSPVVSSFSRSSKELMIKVRHANKNLARSPSPPELHLRTRQSGHEVFVPAQEWNGATESTFVIGYEEFNISRTVETAIWDPRIVLRGDDQLLDMGRIGLPIELDKSSLLESSVPGLFTLYRSQQGNFSIKLFRTTESVFLAEGTSKKIEPDNVANGLAQHVKKWVRNLRPQRRR